MYSTEKNITADSRYYIYTPTDDISTLFLYPTVVGSFGYEAGYSLERSRYDSFLIILIESGSMEILLDGRYIAAQKGDAVLLDCYKPHAYRATVNCKTLWIHFDGPMAKNYFEYLTKKSGNIITVTNFKKVRDTLAGILAGFETQTLQNEFEMSISINNILLELSATRESSGVPIQDGIKKVTAYITDNFQRELPLNELSAMAGFSPYYFSRIFKKETGKSPHQFLISSRIAAAKYSLSNTNMSISEIAFSCGFDDESAFCYCFRKKEGYTPTEYRKRAFENIAD